MTHQFLKEELYHATYASPASIEEYGLQPSAENPAQQENVNMNLFNMWWNKQHSLANPVNLGQRYWENGIPRTSGSVGRTVDEMNKVRAQGHIRSPPITRETQQAEFDDQQDKMNRVWATPSINETYPYLDPSGIRALTWHGTGWGSGPPSSQRQPTARERARRVLVMGNDKGFQDTATDHGWAHQGVVPPDRIKDTGLMQQTDEEFDETYSHLRTGEPMHIAWQLLKTRA